MASLAEISIRMTLDLRGFQRDTQKALQALDNLGKEMSKAGRMLSTYVTAPTIAAAAASVKFASDYEESLNKVKVSFGDASGGVEDFAKTTIDKFGIAEGTALDMAAGFGDMATSMGLTNEKAAQMSTTLVGLAGDLASFKNIGIDQANTALSGVFTGETESLKRLGVVMTEANLQQFAMANGINKTVQSMTQAEKVQLRYAYVMNVTQKAQGDFQRTGGGAANQARVMMEQVKELAVQIGQVLLPSVIKIAQSINGFLKGLRDMSDSGRTTIIVVAGLAAAMGPMMSAIGGLMSVVPNLISNFNQMKNSLMALQAFVMANPFGIMLTALGAIAGYVLVAESRFTSLTDASKDFAEVMAKGAESVAKEKAELEKNLAIARNKSLSDKERLAAVKNLNSISPEYLGNLTLESINTKQADKAVKEYTDSLIRKAKVMAAEEKLIQVQKKLLDLQMGNLESVKPSVWQNLGNAFLSAGNNAAFLSMSSQSIARNFGVQYSESKKLEKWLGDFIRLNKEAKVSTDDVSNGLDGLSESALKFGTIAYYEKQIKDLQELQKTVATTSAEYAKWESQIDVLNKKIDAIKTPKTDKKFVRPMAPDADLTDFQSPSLEVLKNQKAYYEGLREQFSKTSDEYRAFSETINGITFQINQIEGVDSISSTLESVKSEMDGFMTELNDSINSAAEEIAGSLAQAIGTMNFSNLGKSLLSTLGNLCIEVGKAAVRMGLAVQAVKMSLNKFNGLPAIAAGIALQAIGYAIKSSFKEKAMAQGGIVYGPTRALVGEYPGARSNPEVVAPLNKLRSMINPAMTPGEMSLRLDGAFTIVGTDLKLLLNRVDRLEQRTK